MAKKKVEKSRVLLSTAWRKRVGLNQHNVAKYMLNNGIRINAHMSFYLQKNGMLKIKHIPTFVNHKVVKVTMVAAYIPLE